LTNDNVEIVKMKVAIIYNRDIQGVINVFGMQNKEFYNEKTVKKVAQSLEKAGIMLLLWMGISRLLKGWKTLCLALWRANKWA